MATASFTIVENINGKSLDKLVQSAGAHAEIYLSIMCPEFQG